MSVSYEGERADRPRGPVEPHDPGFHGTRATCLACGQTIAARQDREGCPLCAGPGPLRPRPG